MDDRKHLDYWVGYVIGVALVMIAAVALFWLGFTIGRLSV